MEVQGFRLCKTFSMVEKDDYKSKLEALDGDLLPDSRKRQLYSQQLRYDFDVFSKYLMQSIQALMGGKEAREDGVRPLAHMATVILHVSDIKKGSSRGEDALGVMVGNLSHVDAISGRCSEKDADKSFMEAHEFSSVKEARFLFESSMFNDDGKNEAFQMKVEKFLEMLAVECGMHSPKFPPARNSVMKDDDRGENMRFLLLPTVHTTSQGSTFRKVNVGPVLDHDKKDTKRIFDGPTVHAKRYGIGVLDTFLMSQYSSGWSPYMSRGLHSSKKMLLCLFPCITLGKDCPTVNKAMLLPRNDKADHFCCPSADIKEKEILYPLDVNLHGYPLVHASMLLPMHFFKSAFRKSEMTMLLFASLFPFSKDSDFGGKRRSLHVIQFSRPSFLDKRLYMPCAIGQTVWNYGFPSHSKGSLSVFVHKDLQVLARVNWTLLPKALCTSDAFMLQKASHPSKSFCDKDMKSKAVFCQGRRRASPNKAATSYLSFCGKGRLEIQIEALIEKGITCPMQSPPLRILSNSADVIFSPIAPWLPQLHFGREEAWPFGSCFATTKSYPY